MAPVFSCFVRSLESKCEAWMLFKDSLSPSATRNTESLVVHVQKTSSAKGFLSAGKLTNTATGIAVEETQLISWARTNRLKKWKRPTCEFRSWSSKSQEAKMMHDLLQPTEIALRRSSSVAHLKVRLDRGSKAWVKSQDLLPFVWFLLVDFSLVIAIDNVTGHGRSGAKKYRTPSRKKVSGRRFKTRSVGLVEAETFFCLVLTTTTQETTGLWAEGVLWERERPKWGCTGHRVVGAFDRWRCRKNDRPFHRASR